VSHPVNPCTIRATPRSQGKARPEGNGAPLARGKTPHWLLGAAPFGRVLAGVLLVLCMGTFSACTLPVKNKTLGFLYSYDSVLRDYKAGHIMEARDEVLHMNKSRPDYANARALLKKKIEPARLRLLRHYANAAKRAEKAGTWFRAKTLYAQAANFSISNATLLKKARSMDLRMRQARMDKLIIQRRKEDAQLLNSLNQYDTPKGLSPTDAAFSRQRDKLEHWMLFRARKAYFAAKREMRKGYPEVAYVEIESFRRLRHDSRNGRILMEKIRKVLPKGLRIPPFDKSIVKVRPAATPKTITAAAIRELVKKREWMKARRYTVIYRREGGKHSDRFMRTIEKNIDRQAASAFKAGRIAFRLEKLDKAVQHWQRAVTLRPDNTEYVHSLNRALQLQERLRILRSEADTGNSHEKTLGKKAKTPSE